MSIKLLELKTKNISGKAEKRLELPLFARRIFLGINVYVA